MIPCKTKRKDNTETVHGQGRSTLNILPGYGDEYQLFFLPSQI